MANKYHIDYGKKGPRLMDNKTGLEVGAETKTKTKSKDLIEGAFYADTNEGVDHFIKTAKLDYPDNPKKQKEFDELGVTMKKSLVDSYKKELHPYNKFDKSTYPSEPKQRGKLLALDKLEKGLLADFAKNPHLSKFYPDEKEEERFNDKILKRGKYENKKPQKRNYWEHFRKTGRILEPTKEEIARTKGPSTWEIIYDSMTPYEKGQWNLEKRKQGMDGRTGDPLPKEKPKKEEPYKYHIDLSVLEEEAAKPVVQDNFMEDKLNNLLLDSAMRKIADANSGIGGISPRMLYAMNSGGPVDDGPPTLEEYLKLGITLANLTPSEQKVVQDLLNRTLFRTKDEK